MHIRMLGPGDTKYTEYQTIITFVITSDDSPPCRDPAEICSSVCSAACAVWEAATHSVIARQRNKLGT